MSTITIGCDIAKDRFDAALWLDQGYPLGTFQNNHGGFKKLKAAVAQFNKKGESILLVVEPTGGYELAMVEFGRNAGWPVALPNPKQARDWAKGVGYRAKSDAQDSLMLAQYGAEQKPNPQAALPEEVESLQGLLKRREDLQKMRQAESNRLKQLKLRPRPSQGALDSIERLLEMLDKELAHLEQAIKAQVKSTQQLSSLYRRFLTIPGVGQKTVVELIVLLYRWQARTGGEGGFKSLTAYVGLDSQTNQSGKSYKRATISKFGSAHYRCCLYMAALGGISGNNTLRYFYNAMVARGKPKKVALVAASRKILVWAWALFTTGQAFDPTKHPMPQITT